MIDLRDAAEALGLEGEISAVRDLHLGAGVSWREVLPYIQGKGTLPHPYMSRQCTNMHEDAAATDVTLAPGPGDGGESGRQAVLTYREHINDGFAKIGMIPTLAYATDGRIVAIGAKATTDVRIKYRKPGGWDWFRASLGDVRGLADPSQILALSIEGGPQFSVLVLDPDSLAIISETPLPSRPLRTAEITLQDGLTLHPSAIKKIYDLVFFNEGELFDNTGGGAYFYLDHLDRAVAPTSDAEIWRVDTRATGPGAVTRIPVPGLSDDDTLVGVSAVWEHEDQYWYATSHGVVGIVDQTGRSILQVRLREVGEEGETVNNSFAVGPDGAFVVTSRALYRIDHPELERRAPVWRATYNHGDGHVKCGQLPPAGSGTTPTLVGLRYVVICDNARDMNVVCFDRTNGRQTGIVRAFPNAPPGQSACDNSIVAHRFRLFVGNTHCYANVFEHNPTGGLTRIDVNPRTGVMSMRWSEADITIWSAVPKFSAATGLLYIYSRLDTDGEIWWTLMGIDDTGAVRSTVRVAQPEQVTWLDIPVLREEQVDRYDNGWGPLYLGPNGAPRPTALISTIQGLLRART